MCFLHFAYNASKLKDIFALLSIIRQPLKKFKFVLELENSFGIILGSVHESRVLFVEHCTKVLDSPCRYLDAFDGFLHHTRTQFLDTVC